MVISDGTLFCRLWNEDKEISSKWNMLINCVFCLGCNLFWSCYANVVLYCDKTASVNSSCRGRRGGTGNVSGVILLFEIYFVCVEFCTNGVVLLMFGFFCRSGHPIEISR